MLVARIISIAMPGYLLRHTWMGVLLVFPYQKYTGAGGVEGWTQLPMGIQKSGNSLDADAKCIFRLVHEGTKVLEITSKQLGCLISQCRLKNRLVLQCKAFREVKASTMFNNPEIRKNMLMMMRHEVNISSRYIS